MSTQRGLPVVWSIPNTTLTGVGLTSPIVRDYTYESKPEQRKLRGSADGITRNRTWFDYMDTIRIKVTPTASTRTLAGAQNVAPAIGSDVTILTGGAAGAGGACLDTQITGSGTGDGTGAFIVMSAPKHCQTDDYGEIDLELERGEVHLATMA